MTAPFDWLRSARWWLVLAILLALAGFAMRQTVALANARTELAELQRDQAQAITAATQDNAARSAQHASSTQENVHAFNTNMLALALQAAANNATRVADSAAAVRLRDAVAARATSDAQATADAAACRALADRHEQLGALTARAIGLVDRYRSLAGRYGELVDERDAELTALQAQLLIEHRVSAD